MTEQKKDEMVHEVSSSERFLVKNQKTIMSVLVAIIAVIALVLAVKQFYFEPREVKAQESLFQSVLVFEQESYELALNGDGNVLGFAQIIDEYGAKAGAAVYFYAGVCELQLGNWDLAIKYLQSYKGKDAILKARATACIGDAYVGLEEYAKAIGYFEKAAAEVDNMYAAGYLLKAGVTAEKLGENAKALGFYETIKDQYPQSMEGYDIDKYIGRVQNK